MPMCQRLKVARGPKHGTRYPVLTSFVVVALSLILLIVHNELWSASALRSTIKHDVPSLVMREQRQQHPNQLTSLQLDLFRPLVEQHQQNHESYRRMDLQYAPEVQQIRRSSDETAPIELLSASSSEPLLSRASAGGIRHADRQREDENEALKLRHLHQVVDTMALLLNEEEEQRRQQTQSQAQSGQLPQMAALQSGSEDFQLTEEAGELQLQQRQRQLGPKNGFQLQSDAGQQIDGQRDAAMPAELMSESAIRQAIEELERVQQQERQRREQQQEMANEESTRKASVMVTGDTKSQIPSPNPDHNQRSSAALASSETGLESLLGELSDQFMSGQSADQPQDSERLEQLRPQPSRREVANTNIDRQSESDLQKTDASIVTVSGNAEHQASETRELGQTSSSRKQPVSVKTAEPLSAKASSLSESEQRHRPSLVIGQLDPVDATSDLSSALANDFYSIQAESIGAQSAAPRAPSTLQALKDSHHDSTSRIRSVSSSSPLFSSPNDEKNRVEKAGKDDGEQQHRGSASKLIAAESEPRNDLDAAAQTSSGQSQEFHRRPLDQRRDNSPNPDFIQNVTPSSGDSNGQLMRSFRPQPIASSSENFHQDQQDSGSRFEPSSTLLPFSADYFWRPHGPTSNAALSGSDDISQQYNRVRQDPVISLPPLPSPQFKSLTSPAPIGSDQAPGGQQAPATSSPAYFTRHSFSPSDPFSQSHQNSASQFKQQQQPPLTFTSTVQPIISVISGGFESVGSNSVSWNPPPAIDPPKQSQTVDRSISTPAPSRGLSLPPNPGPSSQSIRHTLQGGQSPPTSQLAHQASSNQQHSFRPGPSQQFYPGREDGTRDYVAPTPELGTSQPTERSATSSTARVSNFSQSISASPAQANQWSPLVSSSSEPSLGERDVGNTEPRSTVRSSSTANGNILRPVQFSTPQLSSSDADFVTTLTPPFSPSNSIESRPRQFSPPNGGYTSSVPSVPSLTGYSPSTPASAASSGIASSLATTTTASSLEPSAVTTNSTKKDDMVIYYYYYYDDNKNATVVAKNISANGSSPNINGASIMSDTSMDGDGGIEDTPYMEDPVSPATLSGLSGTSGSQRDQVTTSTTTTPMSTRDRTNVGTNTLPRPSGGGGGVGSSLGDFDKARYQESLDKPRAGHQRHSQNANKHNSNDEDDEISDAELDQFQSDQQKPPLSRGAIQDLRRPQPSAGSRSNRLDQFVSSSPPSVPSLVPFSSTFRPAQRNQPATYESSSSHHSSDQFTAGPNTRQQVPASRAAELSANSHETRARHQQITQAPAHSPSQPQAMDPPQGRPPIQATPHQSNRAFLSNASRYGTNANNQFMEPYGMDPAAPSSIAHHSAPDPLAITHQQQQQHQRQPTLSPSSFSIGHQAAKKPSPWSSPSSILDSVLASTGAQLATGEQEQATNAARQPLAGNRVSAAAQNFSLNRQSQQQPIAQPIVHQRLQPAQVLSSNQAVQRLPSAHLPPARQFYPESNSTQLDQTQPTRIAPTSAPSKLLTGQFTPPTRVQPPATTPTTSTTTTTSTSTLRPSAIDSLGSDNKQAVDEKERNLPRDLVRDVGQLQAFQQKRPISSSVTGGGMGQLGGSGRPASFEGNTSNAFTRAPPVSQTLSISTSIPASVGQRIRAQPLAQFQLQSERQTNISSGSIANGSASSARSGPKLANAATANQAAPNRQVTSAPAQSASIPTSAGQQVASQASQVTASASSRSSGPPSIATTLISSSAESQQQSSTGPTSSSTSSTPTSTTTTTTTVPTSSRTASTSTTQAPKSQDAASTESTDSSTSSTRRKFGNRNNRFQTRLSASRASVQQVTNSSTTKAPQVFGSSSTTTRRPINSTTRKSSKQLFAGRRRLGGDSRTGVLTSASPSSIEDSNLHQGAGTPASLPSSSSQEATSPVSASRAKFGNNFIPRSRTTTSTVAISAPAAATTIQPSSSSSLADSSQLAPTTKPGSLFATQRVTFKPRPALLRTASSQKPNTSDTVVVVDSSTAGVASSGSETSDSTSSEMGTEPGGVSNDRNGSSPNGNSSSGDGTIGGQAELVDIADQPESLKSMVGTELSTSSPVANSSSTDKSLSATSPASVATTSAGSGGSSRPKRPLFASRQRSSTLFGNRRPSGTNATSSTMNA